MPMSSNRWRSVYESFVIFFVNGGIFYTFFGGLVLLVIAARATKTDLVLGISFGRIELIWFFALVAMLVIGRFLGWGNIAERKRLESKLKPIERGSVPKSSNRWRSAYESFAIVFVNGGGFYIFFGGLVLLVIAASATKAHSVLGISFGRIGGIWFFGFVGLVVLGSILGWEELAEHKRLEGKLKPIPARGKRIELYEINSGEALGHISEKELKYLIDSFAEWGMEDNNFYILRETVDLFEERGADTHLVATLREMMGEKDDLEIGWTRV